ncbi:MAG TPA: glycosyltransferase family 2 protein [Gemmatimonadales bacterium]|nr:glycosyltransferase family 2 protein [Gemmatimonadales bacterium]
MPQPDLSVVIPVYNEEATLPELRRRLGEVLERVAPEHEVWLVNDGSRDGTEALLGTICAPGGRWRALHFSRNFGHQAAVAAGIRYATGRAVVVMDADLQDPPELLEQLLERWREGYEVVYAQRVSREREGAAKRGFAWAYYRVLQALSPVEIPADTGDFCLMDRKVVDALVALPERNRYVRGLRAWLGFRQTAVPFERAARFAGEPKYTFRKSLGLALNGIISFSKQPLRIATWFGLLVSLASFLLGIWFIILKLTGGFEIRGWASTVVIILFLGGVQLLTIGIIGEYLSRIYDEVKQRPLFVVRATDNVPGR